MEFKEIVKARRSCRSFESTGIPEETIAAILGAGSWASSPLNLQPWEFLVVTDPLKKAEVRKVAEAARQKVTASGGPGWVSKYGLDFIIPVGRVKGTIKAPPRKAARVYREFFSRS